MNDFVTKILELARTATGMQLAWVSRFTPDRQVFQHVVGESHRFGIVGGDSGALCDSYCLRVTTGDLPRNVPDTLAHLTTSALAVTREFSIGSYVGTPIPDESGATIGMLCTISDEPRAAVAPEVLDQLAMLAKIVGLELRRNRMDHDHLSDGSKQVFGWMQGREFATHFQPIVDLRRAGRPTGFEGLSRFGPEHTNPVECFRMAWSCGLGVDLELSAVAYAVDHIDLFPPSTYLSVNVSPHPDVVARVAEVIPERILGRIVLELTEHAVVEDYTEVSAALTVARAAGLRIAVDDAGAGYASFRHVLQLRPDFIKLDMSLTRGIDTDAVKQALTSSWAALATSLGAELIAEGVETAEERDELTRLGVGAAQGYLFARPEPLDALAERGALHPDWRAPALAGA